MAPLGASNPPPHFWLDTLLQAHRGCGRPASCPGPGCWPPQVPPSSSTDPPTWLALAFAGSASCGLDQLPRTRGAPALVLMSRQGDFLSLGSGSGGQGGH